MDYNEAIFIINVTTASIMLLFTFLLLTATRLQGKSGVMALILLGSTLPAYFYGILMGLGWGDVATWVYPFAYAVGMFIMPLLWIFTRSNLPPPIAV